MPQMAPLSWLILFIYFTLIFILYNILNYYLFLYQPKKITLKKNNLSIHWKW
uniref:ATP synthase complex subunit 8 n=1 Tax=Cucujoidea sp. 46 KM-2017 TaxID=2219385 RepID=A0A346RJ56_9CUCU|nr:ATP synthase F0 subunit 8 [Cucujoidea sp. 46 KM-2017]